MKFELRAGSPDFLRPSYIFPGDEDIDQETYRRCITSGYVSSACTLVGAAEGFGLNMDSETFERAKRIGSTAGLLDDFLDDSPDRETSHALYTEGLTRVFMPVDDRKDTPIPEWVDERLLPAVKLLANSVVVLPIERVDALVDSARSIGNAMIAKAECNDLQEYIELLRGEALATSALIYESVSESVRTQEGFEEFTVWCRNAMEFGTLADSSRDLRRDNRAGLTKVGASVMNSMRIAFQIRRPARSLLHPQSNLAATCRSLIARSKFYR